MALEHAGERRRGFAGSFANMGAPAGAVLSTVVLAVVTLLPDEQFLAWGWRIPFLLSAALVALGLWVRLAVEESPVFAAAAGSGSVGPAPRRRFPLVDVLRNSPLAVLTGAGAGIGAFVLQALLATFALSLGVQGGLARSTVLWLFAAGSAVQVLALPAYAALSDRIGRRPVMIGGALAGAGSAYPIFVLIGSGSVPAVLLGFLIGMPLVQAAMYGPLAAFTSEMFATGSRYTGASLGYQLSTTLGGGFAPVIAAGLMAGVGAVGGLVPVAVFTAAACLLSLVVIALARETSTRDISA